MTKSNNDLAYNQSRDLQNAIAEVYTPSTSSVEGVANIVHRDQTIKADGGKLRMELIPTSAYIGLGRVLTHGAIKYSPNSWQQVEYERYIGALIRHLVAFMDDPTGVDADSGLLHTEHLLANAVFLNDAVVRGRIQPK